MRRVVAVLGAVLMVVVAVLVRGVLDDGDDADGGGDRPGGGGSDGEITLLCIDELEDVCQSLQDDGAIDDFELEAAGETIDRLAQPDAELGTDGWLTLDRFPALADITSEQNSQGTVFSDVFPTGRSTGVAIATAPQRTDAWSAACDADVSWVCLGELVGEAWSDHGGQQTWGAIRVGYDSPATSATGLLSVTQAIAAFLGDPGFASNDLDNASRWLRDLAQDLDGRERDTLSQMITQPGSFSAVGTLVNAGEAAAETARGDGTGIFYSAPMYAAEVVLASPTGTAEGLVDDGPLLDALDGARWTNLEDVPALPDAGTLFAVRDLAT